MANFEIIDAHIYNERDRQVQKVSSITNLYSWWQKNGDKNGWRKLIGVISIHMIKYIILHVLWIFKRYWVKLVVHCGDWVSPFTWIHYKKLNRPLMGIFGNNDGDLFRHIRRIKKFGLKSTLEPNFLSFTFEKRRIAVYPRWNTRNCSGFI